MILYQIQLYILCERWLSAMAVGDKQKLITSMIEEILNFKSQPNITFPWLVNKHKQEDFKDYFTAINKVFLGLGGDITGSHKKQLRQLKPDSYFAGSYNFIFEFDEIQHFTTYKLQALELYPEECQKGFNYGAYVNYCNQFSEQALRKGPPGYRKATKDFPFIHGRAAQRAYLDCFRDMLPQLHGLTKTIRISEFEVELESGKEKETLKVLEGLLKKRGL
jgi:hypothetical protein